MLFAIGIQCVAQVGKVNTQDLMDVVLDMKKAATTADKLAPDGSKYCNWGFAALDASNLDSAVSRFLLKRGSEVVPDDISASKMWRVSFIVDDLVNQLQLRLQECNLGMRLNRGIYDVAVAGKPVLSNLQDAQHRFARQAFQQTEWQEWNHAKLFFPDDRHVADSGLGVSPVDAKEILAASLEVRGAWDEASKVVIQADNTKECLRFGPPDKRLDPVELDKLIGRISHVPGSDSSIRAADMWLVAITAETPKIAVQNALSACGYFALWKKKAKKVADSAVDIDRRLKAAITKFDALALKQTEWEEQVAQLQEMIQEQ
jgi:hypothetical protein